VPLGDLDTRLAGMTSTRSGGPIAVGAHGVASDAGRMATTGALRAAVPMSAEDVLRGEIDRLEPVRPP
jgi:2-keto-4-pentenoate hydratase